MIYWQILAMALLVFISRYLFLEPGIPLRLGSRAHRLLAYSSPAVLSAIWAPIVFTPHGELWLTYNNPYLWGALAAAFIAWKTRNVLLTTVLSMVIFLLLNLVIFAE